MPWRLLENPKRVILDDSGKTDAEAAPLWLFGAAFAFLSRRLRLLR